MEKIPSSHTWVTFFQDAGIPDVMSTQYAVMFTDHRIQRDMLSELDRDILSDIGIKAVGDKMAILKHARFISEQAKRDASSKELASGLKKPVRTPAAGQPARVPVGTPPQPKKKIKLITGTNPPTVVVKKKSPVLNPVVPKITPSSLNAAKPTAQNKGKTSVFQRLGKGSSAAVFDRLGQSETDSTESKSPITRSVPIQLSGGVTELPDSSTSTSQRQTAKKVVSLKRKVTGNGPQTNEVKRPSILDRLGQQINQPTQSPKPSSDLKVFVLSPKSNINNNKLSSKPKPDIKVGKLVVAKKPISSNAVSSTSAGLFRGAAVTSSSVFDRLGPK